MQYQLENTLTRSVSIGFAQLLGGKSLDRFFQSIWEREILFSRGAILNWLCDILTMEDFENMMAASSASETGFLSIVDEGVARPLSGLSLPERLTFAFDAYRRSRSLLQSGLQDRHPPIASLCRNIENDLLAQQIPLAERVCANAYLTPSHSQGFNIHYDNHCAIVLQLAGTKNWTVFPPTHALPIDRCVRSIKRDDLNAAVLETTLCPGDVLYVPRGFPHYAQTGCDSSLHLTLSVTTLRWIDVVEKLCQQDETFRQSVKPILAETSQDYFEDELAPRLSKLEAGVHLRRKLSQCITHLMPPPGGRLTAIDAARGLKADTSVRRAPGVLCDMDIEEGEAVLRFTGGEIRLPATMSAVFGFINQRETFTVRDLPEVDAVYNREELVQILIGRGLLQLNAAGASDQSAMTKMGG